VHFTVEVIEGLDMSATSRSYRTGIDLTAGRIMEKR
jgi:hypothetical protein